jgi:hypothetical protein
MVWGVWGGRGGGGDAGRDNVSVIDSQIVGPARDDEIETKMHGLDGLVP